MVIAANSRRVTAFDAFDGSLEYEVSDDAIPSPSTGNSIHKLDDDYFMIQGGSAIVGCAISNGAVAWSVSVPDANRHPGSGTYFGGHYSSSMQKWFNHVYDSDAREARIIAYDLSDPSTEPPVAWNYVVDTPVEILCSGDGKLFLGSTEGKILAVDNDGELAWRASTLGGIAQQSAMYSDGKLYVSAVTWQMICFDGETGDILWSTEKGIRAFSAYRGTVGNGYVSDTTVELDPYGAVRCWDVDTGEQLWKQPAYFNIAYTTMASSADGKIYTSVCDQSAGIRTGGLAMPGQGFGCFDAYTGTLLWRLDFSISTPMLAYGHLYYISGGRLWCIGGDPADWNHGFIGNVDNPRVAVGQSVPSDISYPKWEYQTGGDVYSSPAVVDGKVYVGSTDMDWYCLDAYTGDLIWNFTVGHYVRSSAAVSGGKVFTGADDGYFYALNADTGEQVWKTSAGGFYPHLLAAPEAEARSSPIVIGSRIYCGALDGKLYCLTTSGDVDWTYSTEGPIMGSPGYADGVIYIASTDGYLYAIDTSGNLVWQSSFTLNNEVGVPDYSQHYAIATPSIADGILVIGGGVQYGNAAPGVDYEAMNQSTPSGAFGGGIRMFAFDAETGESIWNISRAGNTEPSYVPCIIDGQIYAGEFFELTAADIDDPNAGPYYAADFSYSNRRHGNCTWGTWVGYQIQSSAAYADDLTGAKIYVGSDIGSVYCLDATDGSTISVFTAGGNVPCSPAIWDGKMYIGATTGKVYCFDDTPTVDMSLWADDNKGETMWNNETLEICGRLTSNPIESVFVPVFDAEGDFAGGSWVDEESMFHPGIPNATVKVSLTTPGGEEVSLTATTDKSGTFSFSYSPTEVGEWGWVVYYDGETKPAVTYSEAYGEWNPVSVTSPTASTSGDTEPEPGLPMEVVYAAIAVIVIVVVAIGAYMFLKRK
jgi:outer membrane protein assembly factor BamB